MIWYVSNDYYQFHWQICWVDLKCCYSNNFQVFIFIWIYNQECQSQQVFVQNHEGAPKLFVYLPLRAVNMFISIVKLTIRIYISLYCIEWTIGFVKLTGLTLSSTDWIVVLKKYRIKRRSNQQLVLLKQHLKYSSSHKVLLMRHLFMALIQNGLLLQ